MDIYRARNYKLCNIQQIITILVIINLTFSQFSPQTISGFSFMRTIRQNETKNLGKKAGENF